MKVKANGRICLFGEHSDWVGMLSQFNAGIPNTVAIAGSIPLGIVAEVEPLISKEFILININKYKEVDYKFDIRQLYDIIDNDKYNMYIASSILVVINHYGKKINKGCKVIIIEDTLPRSKGLSSSACICSLVIQSLLAANSIIFSEEEISSLAFEAESKTSSKCGKLDQVCAYENGLREIQFNGTDAIYSNSIITKNHIPFIIVDIGWKNTDTITILNNLWEPFPFCVSEKGKDLLDLFGETSINYIELAEIAIINEDYISLGLLMWQYQKLFTTIMKKNNIDCCLDTKSNILIKDLIDKKYIYGGKGMGSHGDGACILLYNPLYKEKTISYIESKGYKAYEI